VCDAVDAGIVRTDGRKEHRRSTRNRATPTPGDLVDVDLPDSPTEPDFVAATTESLTGTETTTEETVTATEDQGNLTKGPSDEDAEADATRAKMDELRKRFRECVERNERAPEAEQLSRSGCCLGRIHRGVNESIVEGLVKVILLLSSFFFLCYFIFIFLDLAAKASVECSFKFLRVCFKHKATTLRGFLKPMFTHVQLI
jgi:hypothetical protein